MADDETTTRAESVRMHIYKGATTAGGVLEALINGAPENGQAYEQPPLPPDRLNALVEMSAHVRPDIDAYVTNVHSRGHVFVPAPDFTQPQALMTVQQAVYVDRLIGAQRSGTPVDKVPAVSEEAATERLEKLKLEALAEHARLTSFFSACNPEGSFTDLRERTCQDLESTGNAYWEVLRDKANEPRSLVRRRSASMRIQMEKGVVIEVSERRQLTAITYEYVKVKRRFKKFAEVDKTGANVVTWYKEFGDPRLMSADSGKYYPDKQALLAAEGKRESSSGEKKPPRIATEVYHFSIPASTDTMYGVPRWSGNVPAVLGSRELDETNLDYFMNNAVPALALLVAGGRFGKGTEEKLKEFFEEEVRGRKSTHKMVVLEAESQQKAINGPSIVPKLQFVPLRNAQMQDALFRKYDDSNASKIRKSFRLPASVLGEKTANLADLRFAEEQVFQPLRDDFDSQMNKHFLPALRVRFWKFQSVATIVRDPETTAEITIKAADAGVIVPDEARQILSSVLQVELPPINTIWSKQPIPLTMAILGLQSSPAEAVREQGRQAGDPSPKSQLLAELGVDADELEGLDPEERTNRLVNALSAMPGLGAMGDGEEEDDD